jgi:hypothetical protein
MVIGKRAPREEFLATYGLPSIKCSYGNTGANIMDKYTASNVDPRDLKLHEI